MFHQTNDAELFKLSDQLKEEGYKQREAVFQKGKSKYLPLYEAKMFRPYDHRFASVYVKKENWMIQGQTIETTLVQHQNPEFFAMPRWWTKEIEIKKKLEPLNPCALLAFRNITRSTDTRTVLACFIPRFGIINSSSIILFNDAISTRLQCCLLGNLNSFILDFVAKRKIAHINLNYFLIEQFPIIPPDFYAQYCRWSHKQTLEEWISDRILKLTCTSNDMESLAKAANFKPLIYKWNPIERLDLQAQLDAAFFLLYGIKRKDVEYVLSTFSSIKKESENMFYDSNTYNRILNYYDEFYKKSKK